METGTLLLGRYKSQALAGGSSGAESQHRQSKLGDPEEEPGDAEHCPTGMDKHIGRNNTLVEARGSDGANKQLVTCSE